MTFFRRRLRLWAAVWFLFQGASLSAIVPRDCCATHRQTSHEAEHIQQQPQQPSCHKAVTVTPPDETPCPMRDTGGKACPMHQRGHGSHTGHAVEAGEAAHAHHAQPAHRTDASSPDTGAPMCTMRAICTGPMDALVVLLVQPGVLPNRAAFTVDLPVDDAPPTAPTRLIHGLFSPDLPPPRA